MHIRHSKFWGKYFTRNTKIYELLWWLSSKESDCQYRRSRFDPWVGKIP